MSNVILLPFIIIQFSSITPHPIMNRSSFLSKDSEKDISTADNDAFKFITNLVLLPQRFIVDFVELYTHLFFLFSVRRCFQYDDPRVIRLSFITPHQE